MNVRYLIGGAVLCMAMPAGNTAAQTDKETDEARPITLVGCVMRESDYRDMYGPGQSGPRGPGIGLRNEYMIVDAHELTPGGAGVVETTGTCPPSPGTFPSAYELTGARETEVAPYLGRRVEVTGTRKYAHTRAVGTTGLREPTGGFDPLGHELHLFEVEVGEVSEPTARAAAPVETPTPVAPAETPAPAAPVERAEVTPPAPAPEVVAPAPAPEPAQAPAPQTAQQAPPEPPRQVAQTELPKTASPLALAGLMGLLSLSAGVVMRLRRAQR